MKTPVRGSIAAAVLQILFATASSAAEAPANTSTTPGEAQEAVRLEEIVVTANKRSEGLQSVPSSISVMTREQLGNLHATQLVDYAAYVPGLNVSSEGAPGKAAIALRGLSSIGGGATVGVYLNDAPIGSSSKFARAETHALDLLPYDVAQVEVLRGPQGTLYGAGTIGGLLKYTTRNPDLEAMEVQLGTTFASVRSADDVGRGFRGSANIPLIQGKFAVRASAYHQNDPGFIDNTITGQDDVNESTQKGGRLSALWQANDALSLRFSAMIQRIEADGFAIVTLDPADQRPVRDLALQRDLPEGSRNKFEHYDAVLQWDLDSMTLTSSSSYERTRNTEGLDITPQFGPILQAVLGLDALTPFSIGLNLEKLTQEIRATSRSGDRFEWLVGAYFTDEDSKNLQTVRALDLSGTEIPGLSPLAVGSQPASFREHALFSNVTFKFNDRFDVTGGLRWAHNKQSSRAISSGSIFPAADLPGGSNEDVVTYLVSPRLHLDANTMLYARVATGYRPGGPNPQLAGFPIPPQVDADRVTNYELGAKTRFLDGRGSLDLAVFRIDWKDIVLVDSVGGVNFDVNGGKARSRGAEVTTLWQLARGLRIGVNAAYVDAELTTDAVSLGGLAGDPLPQPKWNYSATADHSFPAWGHWIGRAGVGYRYVGKRQFTLNGYEFPSYDIFDANLGVENGRWTLALYGKNLGDERAELGVITLGNDLQPHDAVVTQPRTFGLSVDVKF